MRALLWPDTSREEHLAELDQALSGVSNGAMPLVILVALKEDGAPIGFLEVGLRSHADGCDPSHPVGFVEGWFVQEEFRNRGVGKELMLPQGALELPQRYRGTILVVDDQSHHFAKGACRHPEGGSG